MVYLKTIDEEINPGGISIPPEPDENKISKSYIIAGRVFDYATSGLGVGLSIHAYHDTTGEGYSLKKISLCKSDGSFKINFLESEVLITNPIELYVYQGNRQLELVDSASILLKENQYQYLKDLFITKQSMIHGIVKRKNKVNAAGCLVELYDDSLTDAPALITYAFTNINGEYKVSYDTETRATLRLKFYNNEDITISSEVPPEITYSPVSISSEESETLTEQPNFEVGDIIEDNLQGKTFQVLSIIDNGSDWTINKKLISFIEQTGNTKSFWKCMSVSDGSGGSVYCKVLERQITYDIEGKFRNYYSRDTSTSLVKGQNIEFNKSQEVYNSYWSPQIVTSNLEEEVNYLFSSNTIDQYTRLINREEEFIPSIATEDTTTPIRSLIKGYGVEDTPLVASLVGATEEDIQHLSQARDFNSQLGLDQEAILFGLAKKGLELDIANFFSVSESTLKSKINEAVSDNLIPEQNDIQAILDDIKDKLINKVAEEFADIFEGINDASIISVINDPDKKAEFIKKMAKYSYDNNNIGSELNAGLWNELSFDENVKEQLKRGVQYSEVCNSNDVFINQFLDTNTNLQSFTVLLSMSKAQIEAKITAEVLASPDIPECIKVTAAYVDYIYNQIEDKFATVSAAYADYIYNQIEDKFATESLLYDLVSSEDIIIEGDPELQNKFNSLRLKLINTSLSTPSTTHFYDILFSAGVSFNIEKGNVRDFLEDENVDDALTTFYSTISPDPEHQYTKDDWIEFMVLIQRVYSITSVDKFATLKALIEKGFHSAFDVAKAGRDNFVYTMQGVLDESICLKVFATAEYKVNKALSILNKYATESNGTMPVVVKNKQINAEQRESLQVLKLPAMSTLFGDQDVTDTKHGESVLGPAAYLVDVLNVLKQFKVSETADEVTLYDKLVKRRPDVALIPLNSSNALTPMPYIDLVMEILENEITGIDGFEESIVGEGLLIKNDTTKTEEQLRTDPEYTRYSVYDAIKKAPITNWLRKPFDIISEELKIFGRALGINRTKLAEPYSDMDDVVNPYFDVLGMTYGTVVDDNGNKATGDYALFTDTLASTYDVLDFTLDAIVPYADSTNSFLVKDFLEKAVMTLDEFYALISSYYVNPYILNQRYTIHYNGKQELSTAYLEFGSATMRNAFVMRMYQFRRLMMVSEWSVPVLDALLFAQANYKAYYSDSNLSNYLVSKSEVEYLGKAKMHQNYLGLSDDQVATIFGQAAVLEYENTTSFIYNTFADNDLPVEDNTRFKEWLTVGNLPFNDGEEPVYPTVDIANLFMAYLQNAMDLSDEVLSAMVNLLETEENDGSIILTVNGIQNIISAWQLAEGFGLSIEELIRYCQLIQFDTATRLTDSVNTLIDIQKAVIANNANVLELLFLLYHQATDEELEEFNNRVSTIVENILKKKEELKPVSELESGELTTDQVNTWKSDIRLTIEEQLKLNTELEINFIAKILDIQAYSSDNITNLVYDAESVTDNIIDVLKRCIKGLGLCEEMQIQETDLNYISNQPIDIFALPLSSDEAIAFEDFSKFSAICQSGKYLKDETKRFEFYDYITNNLKSTFPLSTFIEWSDNLAIWQHNEELEPTASNYYNRNLKWFLHAGEISQFLTQYNISASDALELIKWNWSDATMAKASVLKIGSIAQEKANTSIYKAEMTAGRNALRSKQRDTLVNYLLEKEQGVRFTDVFDLYSYFLIDTQMTPAVSTSRILQATLAVQSFIQRIQLGLETDITFTKKDAKKWEWMGLYRVWEANRKIFLYPENWLEPELRDNKTPFFKELEKELTGKELTKEAVDGSYMEYVSKMEQVANIEICQLYNEEYDNFSVLHVIGRSRFEPHEYFYRKLINESYWTPWEKMGIEINSEHIAPAIIKDRLVVFWLECSDIAKEPSDEDLSVENQTNTKITPKRAEKQLQMQVCWSELIDSKWTRKRKAEEKIVVDNSGTDEKLNFRLAYENGETNYLHILNSPNYYINEGKGYSFAVECFNHVHLNLQTAFEGKRYVIPHGMSNYGQKVQINNNKAWVSLPVAATNGIAYNNNIVENIKGNTRLIYPHQYNNFYSQAPFVVESKMQSVVFIPTVKAERSSVILKKIIRYTYQEPKFRPVQKQYKTIRTDRYYNDRVEETKEFKLPKFFTHEDESLSVVTSTPLRKPITFERINSFKFLPVAPVFKPEIKAGLAYHPYMETLRANLQKYGIDGILDPIGVDDTNHQLLPHQSNKAYLRDFEMNSEMVKNVLEDTITEDNLKYIEEQFEFNSTGAYSVYNWELFFHIPFLLANRFLTEGNYEEALRWMHYIFDPRETEGDAPSKYWKFKPFADYNSEEGIEDLLFDLSMKGDDDPANVELNKQIELWSSDPFKPHNVALMRPGAYMKAVVMRYLDIIIAHGDDLFRTDTTESINEAMQYYMIAAQLLGRKPEVIETEIITAKSYSDMQTDGMGNAIEYFEEGIIKPENAAYLEKHIESNELEIASKPFTKDKDLKGMVMDVYGAMEQSGEVAKLYFGIPKNDKMLAYWDRVADRLFKIRNSLNIDGIKRTLALFAPPIDPALLIRARQAGLSIGEVLKMADANKTDYRFQTLVQRALEICGEVKSLGSQLLSALEKGDTEKISVLRAGHEKTLTELVSDLKEKSLEEAEAAIEQLKLQQENTQYRESYYRKKKKISSKEQQQLKYMDEAMKLQVASQSLQMSAQIATLLPDIVSGVSGFGGSPTFTLAFGGSLVSQGLQIAATEKNIKSSISNHKGSKSGILAGYEHRKEDWTFQADMAKREMDQLKQQEVAAEIRKELAKLDIRNHEVQVEQTQESYEVLTTKFTNEQLYLWMAKEITMLYRSAFDMAYQMAKQAEAAYNYELCPENPRTPLATDFFNAQNKGLLAGEKLYLELKKMEADYLANNKRKFELTKHISLAMFDPDQILLLRSEGSCTINIPEVLYDLDHPGHINRRIKSVSLTIPCVAGAYASISANLSIQDMDAKVRSLATSSAVSDSGLFELNFNDARYLPFEGASAANTWTLTLPTAMRQFDYNSINDVIMHINYTAEQGTDNDKTSAENNLKDSLNQLVEGNALASMFSLKAQYPEAWAKVGTEEVTVEIKKSQLPFYLQDRVIDITGLERISLSGKNQDAHDPTTQDGFVDLDSASDTQTVTIPIITDMNNTDDLMIILKYQVAS